MKRLFFGLFAAVAVVSCSISELDYSSSEQDSSSIWHVVNIENPELRAFCLETYDEDGNGVITYDEIYFVHTVDCSGRDMTSLEGIEIFPNLDTLICHGNHLETLNLSQTAVSVLFANPMDDSEGNNLLQYVYVLRGNEIEYVTSDRSVPLVQRIPTETQVIAIPPSKDGEIEMIDSN